MLNVENQLLINLQDIEIYTFLDHNALCFNNLHCDRVLLEYLF